MATRTTTRRATGLRDMRLEDLARRWQQRRDVRARDRIFEEYYPLACRLAGRYRNPYEPREDLIQVAAAGLLSAVDRFDPDRGVAFPAFAIPTILGELKRHFRNTGWSAHVPRGAQELARSVDQAVQQLTGRFGRSPTVNELARYMEIEIEDVLVGLHAAAAHYSVSLDAPAPGSEHDDPQTLGDGVSKTEDGYGLIETKLSLAAAIRRLPHTERTALEMRIRDDLKQSEIARRLGCSQMQVSRLLGRAVHRLRELTDPEIDPTPAPANEPGRRWHPTASSRPAADAGGQLAPAQRTGRRARERRSRPVGGALQAVEQLDDRVGGAHRR